MHGTETMADRSKPQGRWRPIALLAMVVVVLVAAPALGLGDRLIVAVNSDASVRRIKGPDRPRVPARQRAEVLAALACVDWVVVFRSDTPLRTIEALRPDVLAKGGDWKLDEIVGRREVEGWGGRVRRLREIPGIRTTALLAGRRGSS